MRHINSLTSFRFMIALYVFLFHCHIYFGSITKKSFINNIILNGATGMSLFFMLSGFILSHVYKNFVSLQKAQEYYIKRFARIYPAYIAISILTLPMIWLNADSNTIITPDQIGWSYHFTKTILAIVACVFLLQAWFSVCFSFWSFGGTWSLSVEAFLYALFPPLRFCLNQCSIKRLKTIAISCWIMCCLPYLYYLFFTSSAEKSYFFIYIYVNPFLRLAEFILGIIAYQLHVENAYTVPAQKMSAFFALLFCIATQCLPNTSALWHYLAFNCVFIPFGYFALIGCYQTKNIILNNRCVVWLGKISYSFYLAQFFAFGVMKQQIIQLNMHTALKWLISFVITLGIAALMYYLVEEKFRRLIIKKFIQK